MRDLTGTRPPIDDDPPPGCPDADGDGLVNVDDLVAVILMFGTSDDAADVNGSGFVDVDDSGDGDRGLGVRLREGRGGTSREDSLRPAPFAE